MPDGVRLAAKLWLPDIAQKQRVPTIIEVIPYRKRDIYAPRDAMHHRYFAGHGYATLRIDIRGSGDSDVGDSPHCPVDSWDRRDPVACVRLSGS